MHIEQRKGYAYHVRENPETGKPGVAPPAPLKALDLKLRLEVPLALDVPALEHAKNGRGDARVEGVRGQKKNLKQPRARALPREERRALGTALAPTAFAQAREIWPTKSQGRSPVTETSETQNAVKSSVQLAHVAKHGQHMAEIM